LITPLRPADEQHPVYTQHIPTIQSAGCFDAEQLPVGIKSLDNSIHLGGPGYRTRTGDDRQFIQNDGNIFDKDKSRGDRAQSGEPFVADAPYSLPIDNFNKSLS